MVNGPKEEGKGQIMEFTQCPNCGCTKRLAYETLQKEVNVGKMAKNTNAFLFNHQSIIAKDMNWLSAPMIITFYDMCMECGTVYCIHAEVKLAIQGMKMPGKDSFPGHHFSPS